MKVTKREAILSVAIVAAMSVVGFVISDSIAARQDDKRAEYYKAIQIQDEAIFRYAMNTNAGNAFVYGDLKAVDTVTYPEISGEYMSIEKVEEHYNMHTRRVKSGKRYRTEVYFSWDYYGSEKKQCERVNFCGINFPSSKIDLPTGDHVDTVQKSPRVRFKYYGTPIEHNGTIYTTLKEGTISESSDFVENHTIEETVKMYTFGWGIYVFWFFWIAITAVAVVVFVRFENRWLY